MGVSFVKGKVAKIHEKDDNSGDLILRFENIETGQVKEMQHDLVVLSVGVKPNNEITRAFKGETLDLDEFNFIRQVDVLTSPAKTSIDGVFVAGTAAGPMDIPDSILSAGAAASEVASYMNGL
jgi:heterodisulfide reductase subunit A